MNRQTVAILTTDKITERLKERLNQFPEELKEITIKPLKENETVFLWDYKPFFPKIDKEVGILATLREFDNSKTEGYKLLAHGDDGLFDYNYNDTGFELFEGYDMEIKFNFIEDDFDLL